MEATALDTCPCTDGQAYTFELETCAVAMRVLGYVLSSEPTAAMLAPLRDPAFDGLFAGTGEPGAAARGLRCLASWRRGTTGQSDAEVQAAAAGEWLAVLGGAGRPQAAPWQSCYTDPDGLLFGSDTLAVRGWYRRYGLEFDAKNREPDDHIGLMLSFLAVLADRERALLDAGRPVREIEQDQLTFIERHPATFVARWAQACTESTSFLYAGLALLAQAAVEQRAENLRGALARCAVGPCGCAG